ncbi:MAG: hypothetical protein GC160_01460 [Acidobacteria bacterium]|nr:hypothetical protein [Acidobacteriota bacterium]
MAMYQPLSDKTSVQQLQDWVQKFQFESGPDGLVVTPPDHFEGPFDYYVDIPERLRTWLVGLRLLRGVPLTHLVPDPALLPPESIRFFYVDPTWTDRLVDGALSVAGIGTSDLTFAAAALTLIRDGLDHQLEAIVKEQNPGVPWTAGKEPMTGMLIRSELVRRWPDLVVRAKKKQGLLNKSMAILRKEPVSRDVMIALFAGLPTQVEVREPDVAMRFGVEPGNKVNLRGFDGVFAKTPQGDPVNINVPWRDSAKRTLNVQQTAANIGASAQWTPGKPGRKPGARDVALTLEQLPYVQVFTNAEPESDGSKSARQFGVVQGKPALQLRRGRFVHIDKITTRASSLLTTEEQD